MSTITVNRRNFLKVSAAAGGGLAAPANSGTLMQKINSAKNNNFIHHNR